MIWAYDGVQFGFINVTITFTNVTVPFTFASLRYISSEIYIYFISTLLFDEN